MPLSEKPKTSAAGEAWNVYYRNKDLPWLDNDAQTSESLRRFADSEWISIVLNYAIGFSAPIKSILEAGCGSGRYGIALALKGYDVTAFDYNQGSVDLCRILSAKCNNLRAFLKYSCYANNILEIDQDTDKYDLCFNQAVLEYFQEDDFKKALKEMVRVTRIGGAVAVILQHTAHPFKWYWQLCGWKGFLNQPKVHSVSPELLRKALFDEGLKNIVIDGIYPWKSLFFPFRPEPNTFLHELVYFIGEFLTRYVPLPRFIRSHIALQIVGMGIKA